MTGSGLKFHIKRREIFGGFSEERENSGGRKLVSYQKCSSCFESEIRPENHNRRVVHIYIYLLLIIFWAKDHVIE